MENKKATTKKSEAIELAAQQHMAIREFLDQEPTRTNLLKGLIEKKGKGNELTLLEELLERKGPITGQHMQIDHRMPKATVSGAAKAVSDYLEGQFSDTVEQLNKKSVKICVWSKEGRGGLSVGYHFICFNTNTKKYLDVSETRDLFRPFWDVFIKNRLYEKLQQEAEDGLSKKLEGRNDYQPFKMEVGLIEKNRPQNEIDRLADFERPQPNHHNRIWESFNIDSLLESRSSYIVSVNAGTGKTTFLRHLQIEFIQKTPFIPIFLDASQIEEWKLEDSGQFAEKLAKIFDLKVYENKVVDFFTRALKKDVVLLIDGLDQIKGGANGYECMVNYILKLMGNNVIIASRPSAIMNLEDDEKFAFLRLKPFDVNAQRNYFGENYERAKQLSVNAPDLIAIPMLAHMVRMLIEEKQDKHINNRTGLYEKFISHILTKYKHGKARLSPDVRTQIRKSLGKIAYDALAEKKPYIQIIPLAFCYGKGRLPETHESQTGDLLTKSGLVNLIIERSGTRDEDFLFFTHQSFQEYLAAEWASADENRTLHILNEKWNPKWHEVICFLVGIKGQGIIEKVINEKDNPIHSRLFLSAKLVPETNVNHELRQRISQKIESMLDDTVFGEDATQYLPFLDERRALNRLVVIANDKDKDSKVRSYALQALSNLGNIIDNSVLSKIVRMLKDEDWLIRYCAAQTLSDLRARIEYNIAEEIVDMARDKDCKIRCYAAQALGKLGNIINDDIAQNMIMKLAKDRDSEVRSCALHALGDLGDKFDSDIVIVKLLVNMAENKDEDSKVRSSAIKALGRLGDRIDDDVIKKIAEIAEDKDSKIRSYAVQTLDIFRDRIDDDIIKMIINMTADKDSKVRCHAAQALGKLGNKIDDDTVRMIVKMTEDDDAFVRYCAVKALYELDNKINDGTAKIVDMAQDKDENCFIRSSVIHILCRFDGKIDNDIIKMIVAITEDKDEDIKIRSSAVEALGKLGDRIDNNTVKIIVDLAKHSDEDSKLRSSAIKALNNLGDRIDDGIAIKPLSLINEEIYSLLNKLYRDGKIEFLNVE